MSQAQKHYCETKRGDTVKLETNWAMSIHIYDGEKLVVMPKASTLKIPKEFPVITEFPIHYWDRHHAKAGIYFDYRPYEDQILNNYRTNDNLGDVFFPGSKSTGTSVMYGWTSFKIQWLGLNNEETRDLGKKLIPVLDKIVTDYPEEIYYIIFLPYGEFPFKETFTNCLEGTIDNSYTPFNKLSSSYFSANVTFEISPKMEELKDYILYLKK